LEKIAISKKGIAMFMPSFSSGLRFYFHILNDQARSASVFRWHVSLAIPDNLAEVTKINSR
jgi:hypothetical protein